MFWPQGGSRSNIFTGRSIFNSSRPSLGQDDVVCEGDICIPVASRLDPSKAKLVYDQMQFAFENARDCILNTPGGSEMFEQLGQKVKDTVQGVTPSAALIQAESDYLTRFQACVAPLMQAAGSGPGGEQQPGTESKILGIPQNTFLIGAGSLGALGLIVALVRK